MHVEIVFFDGSIINLIVKNKDITNDCGTYIFDTDAGKCQISNDNIESISFKEI